MVNFESKMSEIEKEKVLLILKKLPVKTSINEFLNTIDRIYTKHIS